MLALTRYAAGFQHYALSLLIIWLAVFFYRSNPYYANFLRDDTQTLLMWLAVAYSIGGLISVFLRKPEGASDTRTMVLVRALRRLMHDWWIYLERFVHDAEHPVPPVSREEKTALLFLAVKVFFLPLMINFMFTNLEGIRAGFSRISGFESLMSVDAFNLALYPFIFSAILFVDTVYFSFGYAFEGRWLYNEVRSVEPTALGWIVTLACYPPFSEVVSRYAEWYADDFSYFASEGLTASMRIAVLLLMLIYLSATIALGTKASNLTNRGIVSVGPYRFVRHPAYISKNLAWWILLLPVFSVGAFVSMLAWSGIYFLRAITEERHLIADPDYREYCSRVRYRFIPGIY